MSDFETNELSEGASVDTTSTSSPPEPEIGGIAADRLRSFVERIERLEEEKKAIADDIKEIYSESKSIGFDTKILRKIVSLRKMDEQERNEQEELIDVYKHALGMI